MVTPANVLVKKRLSVVCCVISSSLWATELACLLKSLYLQAFYMWSGNAFSPLCKLLGAILERWASLGALASAAIQKQHVCASPVSFQYNVIKLD